VDGFIHFSTVDSQGDEMEFRLIEDDSINEALFHKMKIGIDKNGHKVCELMFAMPLSGEGVPLAPQVNREFLEMRNPGSPSVAHWKDRDIENQVVTSYSSAKPAKELFEIHDATICGIYYLERDAKTRTIHLYFSVKVACGKHLWDWAWTSLVAFVRLSISPAQMEIPATKGSKRVD
jgi:hypothetical protein